MLGKVFALLLLATAGNVSIDAVYPDPATPGDVGEFVVLDVPEDATVTGVRLTDGEDTVNLSNLPAGGRIAITEDPSLVDARTDLPVHPVDSFLSLRNGGEWVAVTDGTTTLSNLSYPNAHEGELYRDGTWTPLGRSDFEGMAATNVSTTSFVLPDESAPIPDLLESAEDRILVGGYTFTDPSIAQVLVDAHRRDVQVEVLVEGGPVGGISSQQVQALDRLCDAGIPVHVMGASRSRYDFHHAKFAIVDDRALVTSENWKPGGVGGHGSRGWGVLLDDRRLAAELATVFRTDAEGPDISAWEKTRPANAQTDTPDNGTYPSRFQPERSEAERVSVLVAPDNAAGEMRDLLGEADESIRVQQVSIGRDSLLMNETLAAARRGVSVKILISGAWFVESENRKLVEWLRRLTERENLPLEARLVEPRNRFEYVHAKGVIVDDHSVVVGSINWNDHALFENREVAVRIDDPEITRYYERTFRADWRGAVWRIQWSLLAVTGGVLIVGLVLAARFARFGTGGTGLPPE